MDASLGIAMVIDSLATSYLLSTSSLPDRAAEAAAILKKRYAVIRLTHILVPVAVKTLGPVNAEGLRFLDQTVDRLTAGTGDPR